jgi:spore germination protein
MTYEWGYMYGPPMAVAPLPEVTKVVDYALTEIPAEKILLGIPTYGYDTTLPYEQGRPAVSISTPRALELAWRNDAVIEYDGESQAPYFRYYTPQGVEHIVWFEDLRSMEAKYHLVQEKGLRGVSFWNLTRPFPANLLLLSTEGAIEKVWPLGETSEIR